MAGLRVEEARPAPPVVTPPKAPVLRVVPVDQATDWRKLAIATGERLSYAETQLKDLRQAADDARARFTKYKTRLDHAQERINLLQADLVRVTAELEETKAATAKAVDDAQARLVPQDVLKQRLWELWSNL